MFSDLAEVMKIEETTVGPGAKKILEDTADLMEVDLRKCKTSGRELYSVLASCSR